MWHQSSLFPFLRPLFRPPGSSTAPAWFRRFVLLASERTTRHCHFDRFPARSAAMRAVRFCGRLWRREFAQPERLKIHHPWQVFESGHLGDKLRRYGLIAIRAFRFFASMPSTTNPCRGQLCGLSTSRAVARDGAISSTGGGANLFAIAFRSRSLNVRPSDSV
jgi:hypothetical protein